jgi:hypothetical protein
MHDDQSHPTVRYLSRADAAKYISCRYGFSCSPQWLAKLAVTDAGPIFQKAGRFPVYRPADLDSWATQRVVGLSPDGGVATR